MQSLGLPALEYWGIHFLSRIEADMICLLMFGVIVIPMKGFLHLETLWHCAQSVGFKLLVRVAAERLPLIRIQ